MGGASPFSRRMPFPSVARLVVIDAHPHPEMSLIRQIAHLVPLRRPGRLPRFDRRLPAFAEQLPGAMRAA
jgi:hypothetical protein